MTRWDGKNQTADRARSRLNAARWASSLLADPRVVILDSETTGLGLADFCSLSVLDVSGEVLYDGKFLPVLAPQPGAVKVHGMTLGSLAGSPDFRDEWPKLSALLFRRRVVVYNAVYDATVWRSACSLRSLPQTLPGAWECAMVLYSAFIGEYGKRGDYKWQKLVGGDHSALGDCRATLATLQRMAATLSPDGAAVQLPLLAGVV